jgi:hypothetical protein
MDRLYNAFKVLLEHKCNKEECYMCEWYWYVIWIEECLDCWWLWKTVKKKWKWVIESDCENCNWEWIINKEVKQECSRCWWVGFTSIK